MPFLVTCTSAIWVSNALPPGGLRGQRYFDRRLNTSKIFTSFAMSKYLLNRFRYLGNCSAEPLISVAYLVGFQ